MLITLFDLLGRWCVTRPWSVLTLYGVLVLGTMPLVSHLSVEADVRNMLPGEMAQTLERYHTLFGTSDLAVLLVHTTAGRQEDLIAFGTALQQQLAAARAQAASAGEAWGFTTVDAPIDGVILKRMRESESIVPAGEPLLEVGDPHRLEIVSDLLSTDAVRVKPGARALIEQWGGEQRLDARVRRVEPAGFTKVSALGVEEQRVNVVLDFVDPAAAFAALGDAYRVEVRVVLWEGKDVLRVPTSALFREGEGWAVYRINDGRAHRTPVELGHQTGQEAEVVSGLDEGARVILHPADTLADGSHVRERSAR